MNVGTTATEAIGGASEELDSLISKFDLFGTQAEDQAQVVADGLETQLRGQLKEVGYDVERFEREFRIAAQEGVWASDSMAKALGLLRTDIGKVETRERLMKDNWVRDSAKIELSLEDVRQMIEDIHDEVDDLPDLKTITIRIKYETVGDKPTGLQHGFHGIVTGPMPVIIGERGPEEVHVTPLRGRGRGGGLRPAGEGGGLTIVLNEPIFYGIEDFEEAVRDVLREEVEGSRGFITGG